MNPRIANAFRCPAVLTEADYVELATLWKKDAKAANARVAPTVANWPAMKPIGVAVPNSGRLG
jgi:hypothetical protein